MKTTATTTTTTTTTTASNPTPSAPRPAVLFPPGSIDPTTTNGNISTWLSSLEDDLQAAIELATARRRPDREVNAEEVAQLARLRVDVRRTVLVQVTMDIASYSLSPVLATFSNIPSTSTTSVGIGSSATRSSTMRVEGLLWRCGGGNRTGKVEDVPVGHILLFERDDQPFLHKALYAMSKEALAVVVIQKEGYAWPFQMTASTAVTEGYEGSKQQIVNIPVMMVSPEDGAILRRLALNVSSRRHPVKIALVNDEGEDGGGEGEEGGNECSICRENFIVDEEILKLPCRHCYHATCLSGWLVRNRSCPLCRSLVPSRRVGGSGGKERGRFDLMDTMTF
eukprot:gene3261-3572_t